MQPDYTDGFGPVFLGGLALYWLVRVVLDAIRGLQADNQALQNCAAIQAATTEKQRMQDDKAAIRYRSALLNVAVDDWRVLDSGGFVTDWTGTSHSNS